MTSMSGAITSETATLIAAGVAALSSLATLLIQLFTQKRAEFRMTHRKMLETDISAISEALHSTLATSNILSKAKTEESLQNWRARAEKAKETLKSIRVKHRYDLWGITDSMQLLSRLPDWIEHSRNRKEFTRPIFNLGRLLGSRIDRAIRYSYSHGMPPCGWHRLLIASASWQLKRKYDQMKKNEDPKQEVAPDSSPAAGSESGDI